MFELKVEDKDVLMEELQKPWQVQEKAVETDINVLKWVEDLEQRVVAADLHLKVRNLLTWYALLLYIVISKQHLLKWQLCLSEIKLFTEQQRL